MYFKKLELVGFKSFMEKTTLHFEPGVTAIVGPNGCGKSNIFDSIRWVLGEQSVKALRGSQMEDVIFNGTDMKEPLGMAEVSLTFDNEKRLFPVDQNEVIVTRRIFRSGENEYLLNKTQVRLKDVSDLLMGTGIGAESYSLVEQGKIDLILSSKPEDRRLVFDEAAGITRYKTQKKEALRKLEDTEQNLLRVNDIIAEVRRQISSLERQANKARRYKEAFEALKSKEINLAVLQRRKLTDEKSEIMKNLGELEVRGSELLNSIKEQEAQINSQKEELKVLENNITDAKNKILNLDNFVVRNNERMNSNKERIIELNSTKKYLETQVEQVKGKLILNEDNLNKAKEEYDVIKKNVEEKSKLLEDKEKEFNGLNSSIKISLENVAKAKKEILYFAKKSADLKNEFGDLTAKQQILMARKKRLEVEKAKVGEEKNIIEGNLKSITDEVESFESNFKELSAKVSDLKDELGQNELSLKKADAEIEDLEKQKLTLESHREFLEKLKTKYEDISESLNVTVYLDKRPCEKVTGLVVKIKDSPDMNKEEVKFSGEAKPIDLDTQRIDARIAHLQENLSGLKDAKAKKEAAIEEIKQKLQNLLDTLRTQEIVLANKKASHQSAAEQFNKIKEEEEIIIIELSDVQNELSAIEEKLTHFKTILSESDNEQKRVEDLISTEQSNISSGAALKEKVLVEITRIKTELDSLSTRIIPDEAKLKVLEESQQHDKNTLIDLEAQIGDIRLKEESLNLENKDLEVKNIETQNNLQNHKNSLKEMEDKYVKTSSYAEVIIKKISSDKIELDSLKQKAYELQMQNKDIEFKTISIKERILQVYKTDFDALEDNPAEKIDESCENVLLEEVKNLKEKLNSLGTVNLVAIEEYDELKKRYDFLVQQQDDLNKAKESLNDAIQKINRITKKMFSETFEKIRIEFRNYFKLLFNGGDAQVFLIDEQDILESGIEIICRPPGKKLQNVLLLSGGEKSLSAIALIFAVFKVKPSPFCILDEIDAALDEANVDRFGRILQEFTGTSQFIIITHNKKTIANASVMYGITMEHSGISKIVSVKFAQNKATNNNELIAEPA